MEPSYFVGAYAASPAFLAGWDAAAEGAFLAALRRSPRIAGLELPFFDSGDSDLYRGDPSWFLAQLAPAWDYTLTCIPGTMDRLAGDGRFGIASPDEPGRGRALAFLERARAVVHQLAAHARRAVVRAVVVHSAPTLQAPAGIAGLAALTRSLRELRGWDWAGAEVWLEHCDAYTTQRASIKGFLPLADELTALAQSGGPQAVPAGLLVNWGRSAIELHDADAVPQHLEAARDAGLLRGLMLSGVATADVDYGDWADSHAPLVRHLRTSLLTPARVSACMSAAGPVPLRCFGVKIQTLPRTLTPAARAATILETLAELDALR